MVGQVLQNREQNEMLELDFLEVSALARCLVECPIQLQFHVFELEWVRFWPVKIIGLGLLQSLPPQYHDHVADREFFLGLRKLAHFIDALLQIIFRQSPPWFCRPALELRMNFGQRANFFGVEVALVVGLGVVFEEVAVAFVVDTRVVGSGLKFLQNYALNLILQILSALYWVHFVLFVGFLDDQHFVW